MSPITKFKLDKAMLEEVDSTEEVDDTSETEDITEDVEPSEEATSEETSPTSKKEAIQSLWDSLDDDEKAMLVECSKTSNEATCPECGKMMDKEPTKE